MRATPSCVKPVVLAAVAIIVSALTPAPAALARIRAVRQRPIGHYRMGDRGLYVAFERRGWSSEYWTGDLVRRLFDFDSVVGSTVAAEVDRQLAAMAALGVNTITLELRSVVDCDCNAFPSCQPGLPLGFLWPDPQPIELTNLRQLLDLVRARRIKVFLRLVNIHMDEPFDTSQRWLGPILGVVGVHPAVDLILFEGTPRVIDTNGDGKPDSCGIPAEPPLWLGPHSVPARYVESAISYAMSLGVPARKLSAEAVVGAYMLDVRAAAGPDATESHLWPTVEVLNDIFDDLAIPSSQRTYALSMYEHRKCDGVPGFVVPPCVDEDPPSWADETLKNVMNIVGRGNGARVVAPEMGNARLVSPKWRTEWTLESLGSLFEKWGVEGGCNWIWTHSSNQEDGDPTVEDAVKRRGVDFVYNPVAKEITDLGGFHLNGIPNGSFESGDALPSGWSITGDGTAARYDLTAEAGEPEVPTRGRYALRLTTGSNTQSTVEAVSEAIAASPRTTYTTTLNLRFAWSGSGPGTPAARPQVYVAVRYFDGDRAPVGADLFRYFQEDSTNGFATFPVQYTTPSGTFTVRIAVGAARNGLAFPIVLDADNIR